MLRITTHDGLAGNDVHGIYDDQKGNMWFESSNGLTRKPPSQTSPSIDLIKVRTDKAYHRTYNQELTIQPFVSGTQITFSYQGISFKVGGHLQYQYRLEGKDEDWQDPTTEKSVGYSNLKPGTYTFFVKAIDRDLIYSEPKSVTFDIKPRLRQKTSGILFTTQIPDEMRSSGELTINGHSVKIKEISADGLGIRILGDSDDLFKKGLNYISNQRKRMKFWKEEKKLKPFAEPYKSSHAILIAIDDYDRANEPKKRGKTVFRRLEWMVEHAEKLKQTLQDVGFPPENIQTFYNSEATSTAIETALESFWKGGSIDSADRLFFYLIPVFRRSWLC
jgi:hypothetical protein